jgi:hypothetical protein
VMRETIFDLYICIYLRDVFGAFFFCLNRSLILWEEICPPGHWPRTIWNFCQLSEGIDASQWMTMRYIHIYAPSMPLGTLSMLNSVLQVRSSHCCICEWLKALYIMKCNCLFTHMTKAGKLSTFW